MMGSALKIEQISRGFDTRCLASSDRRPGGQQNAGGWLTGSLPSVDYGMASVPRHAGQNFWPNERRVCINDRF